MGKAKKREPSFEGPRSFIAVSLLSAAVAHSTVSVIEGVKRVGPIAQLRLRREEIIVRRGDRRYNGRAVRAACQVELGSNQLMNHCELVLSENHSTGVVTLCDCRSKNGVDLRSGKMVCANDQLAGSIDVRCPSVPREDARCVALVILIVSLSERAIVRR